MSKEQLIIRILGCGSSGGVPRIGNNWGDCDPLEPKNRRTRCSILATKRNEKMNETSVLVDTSPDMREQLLAAKCSNLDAVLYTHDHADQTHGLDDLRQICYANKKRVAVYMNEDTRKTLHRRFGYAFFQVEGSAYPVILDDNPMPLSGCPFYIEGEGGAIPVLPFDVDHGPTLKILGFRFENCAYTPDVSNIPSHSLPLLKDLDIWIIDALRIPKHPTHFNLEQALGWIEKVNPKQAILTNMHIDMDYHALCERLPAKVVPAFDGMEIAVT